MGERGSCHSCGASPGAFKACPPRTSSLSELLCHFGQSLFCPAVFSNTKSGVEYTRGKRLIHMEKPRGSSLDGIHLAALSFLIKAHQDIRLATFDQHMRRAASEMGIPLALRVTEGLIHIRE